MLSFWTEKTVVISDGVSLPDAPSSQIPWPH